MIGRNEHRYRRLACKSIRKKHLAPALARLAKGVTVDGLRYGPIRAALDKVQGSNAWLTMSLTEGKNREVRKLLDHVGLAVNRLIRTAYGPYQLGKLAEGTGSEGPQKVLHEQLGSDWAEKLK